MALTKKQEHFCIEVSSGKSKSEAYRIAYDAENMKPETINTKAYELSNNGHIAARISELLEPMINKAQITLLGQIERLNNILEKCEDSEKYSDAINALKEQNKLLGLYEVDNKQKTDTKPARITFTKRDGNK